MAQITTRKVVEGLNNLVLHAYFESDGVSGELSNFTLLSPADLVPKLPLKPTFRIVQIWHSLNFNLTLKFNSLQPTPVWVIKTTSQYHFDFSRLGGLTDAGVNPDSDGKLVVSSAGFNVQGINGALFIEFRKP